MLHDQPTRTLCAALLYPQHFSAELVYTASCFQSSSTSSPVIIQNICKNGQTFGKVCPATTPNLTNEVFLGFILFFPPQPCEEDIEHRPTVPLKWPQTVPK